MHLLDANMLIALCDADHVHRHLATSWFRRQFKDGWATCPLTENALLRIMGHTNYPGGPGSPSALLPLLDRLRAQPGHVFWSDSITLSDRRLVPSLKAVSAKRLTDVYLLALAVQHGGKLVTLDRRIDPSLVSGGMSALVVAGLG
jgi:toxin-antitoxin system PIN domain toxin